MDAAVVMGVGGRGEGVGVIAGVICSLRGVGGNSWVAVAGGGAVCGWRRLAGERAGHRGGGGVGVMVGWLLLYLTCAGHDGTT